MSRLNEAVKHTKCRSSASLLPNNLSCSPSNLVYLHRNEVQIVQATGLNERGNVKVITCPDKDTTSSVVAANVGGTAVIVVACESGVVAVYSEVDQKPIASASTGVEGPTARLYGIACDEKTIYVGGGGGELFAFGFNGKALSGPTVMNNGHEGPVLAVACSAGLVISGDATGKLVFWKGGSVVGQAPPVAPGACLCLSAGHGYAVGGFSTGHVRMYDLAKMKVRAEIAAHTRAINAVSVSQSKPMFCLASEDTYISAWTLPTGETTGITNTVSISPGSALMTGACFNPESNIVCAIAYDSRYISTIPVP